MHLIHLVSHRIEIVGDHQARDRMAIKAGGTAVQRIRLHEEVTEAVVYGSIEIPGKGKRPVCVVAHNGVGSGFDYAPREIFVGWKWLRRVFVVPVQNNEDPARKAASSRSDGTNNNRSAERGYTGRIGGRRGAPNGFPAEGKNSHLPVVDAKIHWPQRFMDIVPSSAPTKVPRLEGTSSTIEPLRAVEKVIVGQCETDDAIGLGEIERKLVIDRPHAISIRDAAVADTSFQIQDERCSTVGAVRGLEIRRDIGRM